MERIIRGFFSIAFLVSTARSGAISMGMDGLNNAVVPGHSTPEQYTKEITIANDGICDQAPVYKYASRCFDIIQELDRFGGRFNQHRRSYWRHLPHPMERIISGFFSIAFLVSTARSGANSE